MADTPATVASVKSWPRCACCTSPAVCLRLAVACCNAFTYWATFLAAASTSFAALNCWLFHSRACCKAAASMLLMLACAWSASVASDTASGSSSSAICSTFRACRSFMIALIAYCLQV